MDQFSDEEFLATPLNILANDHHPINPNHANNPSRPKFSNNPKAQNHPINPSPPHPSKSPRTGPVFPGRSRHRTCGVRARADLEPERSLEFDNLRQIKHADPYGRVTLGREFAYQTFIVEELSEGSLLLRPGVIMERRYFDKLPRHTHYDPDPGYFIRIPTMR
jgi:hypothetical protein